MYIRLLHEVHNDISGSIICHAYHRKGSEFLDSDEKSALIDGANAELVREINGAGMKKASDAHW